MSEDTRTGKADTNGQGEWSDEDEAEIKDEQRYWRIRREARRRDEEEDAAQVDFGHALRGGEFIFDQPDLSAQTLWGDGNDVIWVEGEAVMVASVQGLGKTTLLGQVIRGRLFGGEVLGLTVKRTSDKILLCAMDRPKQARRSLLRQFTPEQREVLNERLVVWEGPPPRDFAADPSMLARMADHYGVGDVYVDSLKDAALRLSSDEVGAAYNRARQTVLRDGVNLFEDHHNIKRNPQGDKPSTIADIYGSTWLTSGCGSVLLLVGEPGDLTVKLKHVKPIIEEQGPWDVVIDKDSGELTRRYANDPLLLLKDADKKGMTASQLARKWFDKNPSKNEIEKARRKLVRFEERGMAQRMPDDDDGGHRWSYLKGTPFDKGVK